MITSNGVSAGLVLGGTRSGEGEGEASNFSSENGEFTSLHPPQKVGPDCPHRLGQLAVAADLRSDDSPLPEGLEGGPIPRLVEGFQIESDEFPCWDVTHRYTEID